MDSVYETLQAIPAVLSGKAAWDKLDKIIESSNDAQSRVRDWNKAAAEMEAKGLSSGHAHFRLGILHLVNDADEATGIYHLELAYEQDQKFEARTEPHRMAAYRVLSLVRDFLADLRARKNDWQTLQLDPQHRKVLITTLLGLHDAVANRHILDMHSHTYNPFFAIFKNARLRVFAGENYLCAQDLLEWVGTDGGHAFLLHNEYPLARTIISLYGGVLEAILIEKLSSTGHKTLGGLIGEAYDKGILVVGTRLCALSTVLLYFRNHIHPNREISRTDYFIDIHVARGLKVAIDLVIADLQPQSAVAP